MSSASDGIPEWVELLQDICRDVIIGVAIVGVLGLLLFGVTGVWPPMVSVESGSMEPTLERGDLVLLTDPARAAESSDLRGGVEPVSLTESGKASQLGRGDVIVFQPYNGSVDALVIHRAMFWVEEGEDWTVAAEEEHLFQVSCEDIVQCPAPNSGFITKGDANKYYDQSVGVSEPVRVESIRGVAWVEVPYLGNVRLLFS